MSETLSHWINGQAVAGQSGRTGDVFNPAIGEKIAEVPLASVDEVANVVAAAKAAAPEWAAAPPIRRYINMLHDSAEAKGIQEAWWGRAEDYGIDEPVIRGGLDAFAEAMQLAENETVRVRVEKISICAYMAALEEALTWVWYTPTTYPNTGLGRPIDPEVARRTRPYFRTFFQLCKKHDVTMWNEAETNDHMSDYFKSGFGLGPEDAW